MQRLVLPLAVVGLIGLSLGFLGSLDARAGWCGGRSSQSGRSPASLAAIQIRWETVQHLVKPRSVISGMSEEEANEEPESPFLAFDRPVVVFVYGSASADDDFDKIEEVVLKNEKIGLGMKAFRTVKITPDDAERDGLIADEGKTIPRLLLIDPVKEKIKILESKKIKVGALYTAMKGVAKSFYKENLDTLVKGHLKLLNERDKLASEMKLLADKEGRLSDDDTARARKELEELAEEKAALEKELEELAVEERELWQMTPRHPKEAALNS